jgi:hypothetical protein
MKVMKKYILILVVLVVLSNLPFINFFLIEDFSYSNVDRSFTYNENGTKGLNYISVIKAYTVFLCQNPSKDQGDNRLFRTFTIKPWRFWEWREMILHSDRFSLPYKDPVESNR